MPRSVQLTQTHKLLAGLTIIAVTSLVLYNNFATYNPKALVELPEVRGTQHTDSGDFVIPYPVKSQKISDTVTPYARQITLESEQSSQKIQDFYNTILAGDGWQVDSERKGDVFYTTKYKLDDSYIIIATSEDSGTTVISVEILKNS